MTFILDKKTSVIKKSIYIPLFFLLVFISNISIINAKEAGTVVGGIEYPIPNWFKESFLDIKDDIDEAKQNKKHVILFFYLNGCPYCSRMLEESFSEKGLKKLIQKNFDVIAINIKGDRDITLTSNVSQTEKQLSKKLRVQYTPTILFLNKDNNIVVRLNGYRSLNKFSHILKYVRDEAYKKSTLASYIEQHNKNKSYSFRSNSNFKSINNFEKIKTPLAIIFEDENCNLCDDFHNKTLARSDVKKELKKFTIVRLNAKSTKKIITDTNGNKISPKDWVEALKLTYRPGIILFDKGKEITRIDGLLYSFHLKEVFRYVSGQHYKQFNSYSEYLAKRQTELLEKGTTIDISK